MSNRARLGGVTFFAPPRPPRRTSPGWGRRTFRVVRGGANQTAVDAWLESNPLRSLGAIQALLREIHNSSPVNFYVQLLAGKKAHERLHPETRHGGSGGKKRNDRAANSPAYETLAAEALHCSTRAIRKWCWVADNLSQAAYEIINEGPLAWERGALEKLAKGRQDDEPTCSGAQSPSSWTRRPSLVLEEGRARSRPHAP
jgi:hypothetical protein